MTDKHRPKGNPEVRSRMDDWNGWNFGVTEFGREGLVEDVLGT